MDYDIIVKTGGVISGCEVRGTVFLEPQSSIIDCDVYPTEGRAAITSPKYADEDVPICSRNRFHGNPDIKNTCFVDSGSVKYGCN